MTEINALPLPTALVALIAEGRWQRPADTSGLESLTGFADFNFLDLALMRSETEALIQTLATGDGETYWLDSSRQKQTLITAPNRLDVDNAVVLAETAYDAICLDYRRDPANPAVVASDWQLYRGWRVIAPDIETFIRLIGLEAVFAAAASPPAPAPPRSTPRSAADRAASHRRPAPSARPSSAVRAE